MTQLTRQRGFVGIISLLIVLTFFSLLFLEYASGKTREQQLANAEPFYDHMKFVVQQINAFQMDQVASERYTVNDIGIFPTNWASLKPNYLPHCSATEENKGYCRPAEKTPWGTILQLTPGYATPPNSGPQITIRIPLPPNNTTFAFERDAYIASLAKLPGARMIEGANAVDVIVHRLDNAIQHDGVVKRSGNHSTLTGDWDTGGNYAITNAKDYLVRNSDGSQTNLATAVIDTFVAKHGERVDKPKCPAHLTPDIQVAIKGLFPQSPANNFTDVGMQKAYAIPFSSYWQIGLDYWAVHQDSKEVRLMHEGEVNVSLRCIPN